MKKVLLGTAAIALGLAFAAPAQADIGLSIDGHFKGYVSYVDQDEVAGADVRDIDIIRETEIHFTGETTLDNGLTVGAHIEAEVDGGEDDGFDIDESYVYFSGTWGRVNFGNEDGAAYLLQVAAPSADSNVDGIRQYVSPVNYGAMGLGALAAAFSLDYANDFAEDGDKITYLTPVFSGFQAGVSYSPEAAPAQPFSNGLDDEAGDFGDVWELAGRYEGAFNNVGFAVGAGYTYGTLEADGLGFDENFKEWNVGLDLNIGAFGLGAVYTTTNNGVDDNADNDTWVIGADYTTGPYKLGVSYLNSDQELGAGADLESQRYSAGVTYTYGPGLTFRGSIGYVDHDLPGDDVDATYVLLGTQIEF